MEKEEQRTNDSILKEVFKKYRMNCSREPHCVLRDARKTKLDVQILTESSSRLIPFLLTTCSLYAVCFNLLFLGLIQNTGIRSHLLGVFFTDLLMRTYHRSSGLCTPDYLSIFSFQRHDIYI